MGAITHMEAPESEGGGRWETLIVNFVLIQTAGRDMVRPELRSPNLEARGYQPVTAEPYL